jgi:hypothetical protein
MVEADADVQPAVVCVDGEAYQMEPSDVLFQLALTRMRKEKDLKIVWTARNSATGVGKTTGAGWLGLSWNPVFAGDLWSAETNATLDVAEYFDLYRELPRGSVLILDEAEELDARRSMQQENVDFSHDWMMLRKRQIISILTLPSPSALDSRVEELADVWVNSIKRGEAVVHGIQVLDYGNRNRQTPKAETLEFPDVSMHPELQLLDNMKDEKIKRAYANDEQPDPDEVERQTKIDTAQRMRDNGHTIPEAADAVEMSNSWVSKYTENTETAGGTADD